VQPGHLEDNGDRFECIELRRQWGDGTQDRGVDIGTLERWEAPAGGEGCHRPAHRRRRRAAGGRTRERSARSDPIVASEVGDPALGRPRRWRVGGDRRKLVAGR
jgi:hypothetical protein